MALVLQIVIGVMILASLVVAYLSAKNWPIYQAITVACVLLAAVGYFYLAGRTLAVHNAWGKFITNSQKELAGLEKQLHDLQDGGAPGPDGQPTKGVVQLHRDLAKLASDRGGAFFDAAVDSVKDGVVQLTFKSENHGLVPDTLLFAFDQLNPAEGGFYQGEFKVVTAAEKSPTISIAANLPLTPAQNERLVTAKGPWTLYTVMPIDDATVLSKLSDADRAALITQAIPADFTQLERELRDYELYFHEAYVQRQLLADSISKITTNIERTNANTKQTEEDIAFRTGEKGNLQGDLEKFQFEQKAIATYQQALQKQLQTMRTALKDLLQGNDRLAAELAAAQLKAAEEINRRTGAAQVSAAH